MDMINKIIKKYTMRKHFILEKSDQLLKIEINKREGQLISYEEIKKLEKDCYKKAKEIYSELNRKKKN